MNDKLGIRGIVSYKLTDKDGNLKEERVINNQIQNAGVSSLISLLAVDNPQAATAFDYIAIGSGTGQGVSNNALATEITTNGGIRRGGGDVSVSSQTTNINNDTTQFLTTFNFTGSLSITEAGIFDSASAGTMFAYQSFGAINVNDGDNLQITWKVVLS